MWNEIQNWEIELIQSSPVNKGLNPLFTQKNSFWNDFFSDLKPQKHSTEIRIPTQREKQIHENLLRNKAPKEAMDFFHQHFSKNDDEILEEEENKNLLDYFQNILNSQDIEVLKKFIIMSYRNNLWYGLAIERIF